MRWLFHIARSEDLSWSDDGRYGAPSLATEGFVHCSFKDAVRASAELYFAPAERARLRVLAIDPRRLDSRVDLADTPRGTMPHVHGTIPRDAIRVLDLDAVDAHPDVVTGTRIVLLAFSGMTLLDLVGPLDALSRIATMGFDATTTCEVASLTLAGDSPAVWSAWGAELVARRHRPPLEDFDVLVVPGGPDTRVLEHDESVVAYLKTFPANRLTTSVCTGALLLGAAGRLHGKRATTHHRSMEELARFGAIVRSERVVDEGQLITAGGVTAGIELGLAVVRRLAGEEAYRAIGRQMEVVGF